MNDSENIGEWNKILESLKFLRPETVLVILKPGIYIAFDEFLLPDTTADGPEDEFYAHAVVVSFTPAKDDEDRHTVRVLIGRWTPGSDSSGGLHYVTQQGHLDKALDCMKRSYKALILRSESLSAGACWSIDDEDIPEEDKVFRNQG